MLRKDLVEKGQGLVAKSSLRFCLFPFCLSEGKTETYHGTKHLEENYLFFTTLFPTLSFPQHSNLALDSYHFPLPLITVSFFTTLSSLCHSLFLSFRDTYVPQLQPPVLQVSILSVFHGFLQQLQTFRAQNNPKLSIQFTISLMQKHLLSVPLNQDSTFLPGSPTCLLRIYYLIIILTSSLLCLLPKCLLEDE